MGCRNSCRSRIALGLACTHECSSLVMQMSEPGGDQMRSNSLIIRAGKPVYGGLSLSDNVHRT